MHKLRPQLIVLSLLASLIPSAGCSAELETGVKAESSTTQIIAKDDGGYQLTHNGAPYTILGVGGNTELELLKSYGGNTIRTWGADDIGPLMDQAAELDIAVVVGIWLEHERKGFDYSDPQSKAGELEKVTEAVNRYKDHPALLAWGVGNEVELGGSMDTAIMQINDAAAIIKSLDPNHPTMAVIAEIGDDKAIRIQNECPQIDMLGINSYGGLASLSKRLENQGVTKPYAITEFGPVGHWETGNTPWGAPYEQSSADKASFLEKNYTQTIEPNIGKQCLGSFAFLWGHKQERTATWYGLLLESGETTQSVDVLNRLWTGETVDNAAPIVSKLLMEANHYSIAAGQVLEISVEASDPDGDELTTAWELLKESTAQSMGGDFESQVDQVSVHIEPIDATTAKITAPSTPGAYRIFATVRDGRGHAGTVNLPIMVVE